MLKLVIPGMNYPFVPAKYNTELCWDKYIVLSLCLHSSIKPSVAAPEISVLFLKFYETFWKQ